MKSLVILITKFSESWRLGAFSIWVNALLIAVMVIVAPVASEFAYGQAKSDTIYADQAGRFLCIKPPQEVASPDIEVLAWYAHLKKDRSEISQDTTFVYFFVPEDFSFSIEMRRDDEFFKLIPWKKPWPKGLLQCIGLPNALLKDLQLLAVGMRPDQKCVYMTPIARNAQLPDSLRAYEFRFKPKNMEIKVRHGYIQQVATGDTTELIPQKEPKHYREGFPFPIRWNGRIQGKMAREGNYKLILEISEYEWPGRTETMKCYDFYHKPAFAACPKE